MTSWSLPLDFAPYLINTEERRYLLWCLKANTQMTYRITLVKANCQFRGQATCTLPLMVLIPSSHHCFIILRQKYAIYVPWKKEVLDATLFEYDQEDVIEIEVGAILRPVRYPEEVKRVGMTTHYKIPAGYRPALLGFNREIKVILEENIDDAKCHFRYHYLIRILDAFVEELRKRTVQNPGVFRSRVLNPLIQRQSRGVHDNDSDEVKEAVGANYEDAVDFYLAGDPLDPKQNREWLQHLLNTTPVRLNLGRFRFQYNTDVRQKHSAVPQHTGDQLVLPAFKIEVIRCKYLEELYRKLIGGLVSGHHPGFVEASSTHTEIPGKVRDFSHQTGEWKPTGE